MFFLRRFGGRASLHAEGLAFGLRCQIGILALILEALATTLLSKGSRPSSIMFFPAVNKRFNTVLSYRR
jgi:hypothetical protein